MMKMCGFILGCFVLLASLLVLVLSFAPFTPAVLAMPFLLLLSEVVALMACWRLSVMSVHLCLGTLLCSAMTTGLLPIAEEAKVLFTLVSSLLLAGYLLYSFQKERLRVRTA